MYHSGVNFASLSGPACDQYGWKPSGSSGSGVEPERDLQPVRVGHIWGVLYSGFGERGQQHGPWGQRHGWPLRGKHPSFHPSFLPTALPSIHLLLHVLFATTVRYNASITAGATSNLRLSFTLSGEQEPSVLGPGILAGYIWIGMNEWFISRSQYLRVFFKCGHQVSCFAGSSILSL